MGEELEVCSEEEEFETYSEQPLIEEPEILEEHYISSEESIMAKEREGQVHNVHGKEDRIGGRGRGRGRGNQDPSRFPNLDEDTTLTMKNISPSILPNFHGKRNEDLETFLFEFEVLCRSYDYLHDAQKLKLFPATLKDSTLKWFMSLGVHSITTRGKMKEDFLGKYIYYCMPSNLKDEVFKMTQKEDENLEDLVERFVYNVKREKIYNLDEETIKALLLRVVKDEWIDLLNLTGKGDISQLPFADICDLCVHISRGKTRVGKSPRDPILSRINKSAARTIRRAEIGNLFDTFKIDILGSLSEQIDTLKIQNKQNSENVALFIFCPKFRKKHALRECPLNTTAIETCAICADNHDTKECPSLRGLKAVFNDEGISEPVDPLYFIAKIPWQNP